jgi:hypothetical protein
VPDIFLQHRPEPIGFGQEFAVEVIVEERTVAGRGYLHHPLAEAIDPVLIGALGGHDLMEPSPAVIDKLPDAVAGHAAIGVVAEALRLRSRHLGEPMAVRGIGITEGHAAHGLNP